MKAVIVTSSASYEPRAEMVRNYLKEAGWDVMILGTDFVHREKVKGREARDGYLYLDTMPYYKNLSVSRLISHYDFSRKALGTLEHMAADLLYIMIPANSLAQCGAAYKKRHSSVKLVFDLIDLWPESLPFKKLENSLPVRKWRDLRDHHMEAADLVVTECQLYQEILKRQLSKVKTRTLYWPKQGGYPVSKEDIAKAPDSAVEGIHLCYIGSINNIIDIDLMINLFVKMKEARPVTLHVIGDGEKRQELLNRLAEHDIATEYYGTVYEEKKKAEILLRCDYGINIMKPEVCVGLTMKSAEYLYYGLPLINTIKGDTWRFVEQSQAGVNCQKEEITKTVSRVVEMRGDGQIRINARNLYEKYLSPEAFAESMDVCLRELEEPCRG